MHLQHFRLFFQRNTLISLAVSSRSPMAPVAVDSTGKNDDSVHPTSTSSDEISVPRTSISRELLIAIDSYASRMSIDEVADTLWSLGTLRVKPQFRVVSSDARHVSSELESAEATSTSELIEKLLDRFGDISCRLSDGAVALMMKERRITQPAGAGAGTSVSSRRSMGNTTGMGSSSLSSPEERTTRESPSSSSSISIVDDILQGAIGKSFADDASAEALSLGSDR